MKIDEVATQQKSIVLVFGRLCSGKGTFCNKYIRQGYNHVTTSDIVKSVSGKTTRDELQQTSDKDQLILTRMIQTITEQQPIVVDGIRQRSIVEGILTHFGKDTVELIWLEVPKDIRKERFHQRKASKDTKSFEVSEAGDVQLGLNDVESYVKPMSKIVDHF